MTEEEINKILDTANFILKWAPNELPQFRHKKNFRRKSYIRAKYIQNRKVFFNIIYEKYKHLNKRDKARRYNTILYLRSILENERPKIHKDLYIYTSSREGQTFVVVIKNILRKKRYELYLYAIYPIKNS